MLNISSLLNKFKDIKNPKEEKDIVLLILSKSLGYEIDKDDIEIKQNNLYIKTSGYLKTEVFMKKDLILKNLRDASIKNILDIK